MMKNMKIAVIGLGYIGLPTALMLAANGADVVGMDIKADIINQLNSGRVTFNEDGLAELYDRARAGKIEFVTDYPAADLYISTMPTPYLAETRKVDASYIVRAVRGILAVMPRGATVVVESTVSPGTIDRNVRPLFAEHGYTLGVDAHLAHAPERIIPGNMLHELVNVSRTIGADERETGELVRDVYATFCKGDMVVTDIRTAEMTKVVENTFRSINIAYANELAKLCHESGMDVYEVIRIANMHPRVNILQPGPGVGGHCVSVDPWFLVGDFGEDLAHLTFAAVDVNAGMPAYVLSRISEIMQKHGVDSFARVGLYGLTFKENVDDTRDSPTSQLLDLMAQQGIDGFHCYDPIAPRGTAPTQMDGFDEFLSRSDMVVILVGHDHIKQNLHALKGKVVYDTRNVTALNADSATRLETL